MMTTGMTITRYEAIVVALDPIKHAKGTIGNVELFMTKKVEDAHGVTRMVPYITGDTVRHRMREASVYATLEAAGLLDHPNLSRGASRLLFSGGMVTGKGDAANINIDRYRELIELFPPLSLFGGCNDNRPLPGQISVDEGNVVCLEMQDMFPDWVKEWITENEYHVDSHRKKLERQTRVSFDIELQPEKIKLLSESEQILVHTKQREYELARERGDQAAVQKLKSHNMPRSFQRLAQGTKFWWGVEARIYNDLELDMFQFVLACLINSFRVGGGGRNGHGRLKLLTGLHNKPAHHVIMWRPAAADFEMQGEEQTSLIKRPRIGDLFKEHIAARAEQLKAWLESEVNS